VAYEPSGLFDNPVEKAGSLQFALMPPRTSCILQSRDAVTAFEEKEKNKAPARE
jgi:hypothetical protein